MMRDKFGKDYEGYVAETGRFFPQVIRSPDRDEDTENRKIAELKCQQHHWVAGIANQIAAQIITPACHLDRGKVAGNDHQDGESGPGVTQSPMYGDPSLRDEQCLCEKQHEPRAKTAPCRPTADVSGALREAGSTSAGAKPAIPVAAAVSAMPI